jgi:hypothetical protein
MTPEQAKPYLRLPSGKTLRTKDGALVWATARPVMIHPITA